MNIKEVWAQRSDFSADSFKKNISEKMAIEEFRNFPWKEEIDKHSASAQAHKDSCPPGIGIVTKTGDVLHIFAASTDEFVVSDTRKAREQHVQTADVPGIIKDFWETGAHGEKRTTREGPSRLHNIGWWINATTAIFVTLLLAGALSFLFDRAILKYLLVFCGLMPACITAAAFFTGRTIGMGVVVTRKRNPILFWSYVISEILITLLVIVIGILFIFIHV